jgi:UDP-2,3-diacylglucosamine pyrophosphatase LpxH
MKFAVLSDTHLGDPECTLAFMDQSGKIRSGFNLTDFLDALGKNNDFIIILGDMLDFAINDYGDVYAVARYFFSKLKEQHVLKPDGNVIYSPGNHDYDVWHTIEYEANIINRMKIGKLPKKFRMSVPLVIDDRTEKNYNFYLRGVHRNNERIQPYGGMFLDSLVSPDDPINFIIPFPNIYFVTDENSILMTHGQYFETYWAALGELYQLLTRQTDTLTMKDFIAVNFPLGQLGSSGVGQAGPLTNIVLELEKDVTSGQCVLIQKYIHRLCDEILKRYNIPFVPKFIDRLIIEGFTYKIISELKASRSSDFLSELEKNKDTQHRVSRFLDSTMKEINEVEMEMGTTFRPVNTILFGHTHQPVDSTSHSTFNYNGNLLNLWNTGGWLHVPHDENQDYGGEIFLYETGKGFSSIRLSVTR